MELNNIEEYKKVMKRIDEHFDKRGYSCMLGVDVNTGELCVRADHKSGKEELIILYGSDEIINNETNELYLFREDILLYIHSEYKILQIAKCKRRTDEIELEFKRG